MLVGEWSGGSGRLRRFLFLDSIFGGVEVGRCR